MPAGIDLLPAWAQHLWGFEAEAQHFGPAARAGVRRCAVLRWAMREGVARTARRRVAAR